MSDEITVFKNRTTKVRVSLGFDVSTDSFTAEIRAKASSTSELLATWDVTFATNGIDGELIMTMQNESVAAVTAKSGYTDLKRMSGGEPYPVFEPVKVKFVDTVTP